MRRFVLFALVAAATVGGAEPDHFAQPNAKDADGTLAYVRFDESHMPLRVSVETPRRPALRASGAQTREAVIAGIRLWETAIQKQYPWFRLELVEGDEEARIHVRWRRRLGGSLLGQGSIGWALVDGRLQVGGELEYTTSRCEGADFECLLTADDLRLVVAHEFGHTLGLGHCLSCDSIMNYSDETRERELVTDLDVRTFGALHALPNGQRVDGGRIGGPAGGSGPALSAPEHPASEHQQPDQEQEDELNHGQSPSGAEE